MKLDYIELHRKDNETIKIDFKTGLNEVYNVKFDVPAIGLMKRSKKLYSGLKIYSNNSKNKMVRHLKRFYRHRNSLMKIFHFSAADELSKWDGLDDFKYMLLSQSKVPSRLGFSELWYTPLTLKNILKSYSDSVKCVCINLEEMSDEDRKLNSLICEGGKVLNIDKLSKEFSLLLDYKTASNGQKYIADYDCIDDVLFILDNKRFYITHMPNNIHINDVIFMDSSYGRIDRNRVDELVALDLCYARLCIMTGNYMVVDYSK